MHEAQIMSLFVSLSRIRLRSTNVDFVANADIKAGGANWGCYGPSSTGAAPGTRGCSASPPPRYGPDSV